MKTFGFVVGGVLVCCMVWLTLYVSGCSERRDAKTEDIVYGIVAQHPNQDLALYFSNLEGQEAYKWDVGELSRALSRLIRKGRVVTTEKGVKIADR